MKRLLLVALMLCGCAHSQNYSVAWPDASKAEEIWVCAEKKSGELTCRSFLSTFEAVIKQLDDTDFWDMVRDLRGDWRPPKDQGHEI